VDKKYSITAVCTMQFTTGVLYYGTVWPNTPQYSTVPMVVLKHESCAIAKITARCALYMSASEVLHRVGLESSSTEFSL